MEMIRKLVWLGFLASTVASSLAGCGDETKIVEQPKNAPAEGKVVDDPKGESRSGLGPTVPETE
jgi:hypothetical protein